MEAAWEKVRVNDGAAGVDRQSIERFEAQEEIYLKELSTALREGSYRPQPVRRVEIPKGDGKTRSLGIPTVKDRIVQTAVKFVLEPIFEATFRSMSYGFRPGRGCRDALREVDQLVKEGYTFVVDADLESYFDTIPHERLMQRVEERISDGRVLGLLRSWLGQEIMRGMERWEATEGTPQGAVISPLLSNIYLHPLDELMAACGQTDPALRLLKSAVQQNYCAYSALLDDPLLKSLRKETAFNEILTAASNCQSVFKEGRQIK